MTKNYDYNHNCNIKIETHTVSHYEIESHYVKNTIMSHYKIVSHELKLSYERKSKQRDKIITVITIT